MHMHCHNLWLHLLWRSCDDDPRMASFQQPRLYRLTGISRSIAPDFIFMQATGPNVQSGFLSFLSIVPLSVLLALISWTKIFRHNNRFWRKIPDCAYIACKSKLYPNMGFGEPEAMCSKDSDVQASRLPRITLFVPMPRCTVGSNLRD